MQLDEMIFVSVDDHVVEPPEMFEGRLPAKYVEDAPRVVRNEAGDDVWVYQGDILPNIGLNAVAGRPREEYGVEPTSFDEMRSGCYNVHERVKDMSAGGVLASMNFPSFPSFGGKLFTMAADKELAHAVLQAYNDWTIHEWAGRFPGRFIPLALLPLWDAEKCVSEIRRVTKLGCPAASFAANPLDFGLLSIHDEFWRPIWKACVPSTLASRSKKECGQASKAVTWQEPSNDSASND
jgi:hypothetical protein